LLPEEPDHESESESEPESEPVVEPDDHEPPPGREPAVPEGLLGMADEAPGLPIT
jgi:hypothetical protein